MSNINAVDDVVVVEKVDPPTGSALLLVITGDPECMYGDVVSVGPNVRDVAVGDRVVAPFWSGAEYRGHVYLREDEILGVVVDE